ncbi:hypothetical protein HDV05_004956 [Chytridiales sp. JEL 0842]|nr:hypothetical protein HDV05_004956 [Chytridiales sp. JEL 0842]
MNAQMLPFDPSMLYIWQISAGLVAVVAGWGIWKSTGLFSGLGSFGGVASVPKVGEFIRRKSLAGLHPNGESQQDSGEGGARGNSSSIAMTELMPKQRKTSFVVPAPADGSDKIPLLVTEAMLDLAVALNDTQSFRRVLRPSHLMSALAASNNNNRRLMCYDQQDAHELLQLVSSSLTNEESPAIPHIPTLFDIHSLNSETRPKARVKKAPSVVSLGVPLNFKLPKQLRNPLTGLVANTMSCVQCGYTSAVRHDTFDNISLPVPTVPQVTVEGLLQSYVTPEPIHEYICDKCSLVGTLRKLEQDIERRKRDIDVLKVHRKKLGAKSNSAGGASEGKKKVLLKELNGVTLDDVDKQLRLLLAGLVQMEKDRVYVAESVKFNVEAKLPETVKKVKVVSPLSKKQILIASSPQCLCLHMQRSVYTPTGHVLKNNCRVLFDEYLDIGPFCSNASWYQRDGGGFMMDALKGGERGGGLSGPSPAMIDMLNRMRLQREAAAGIQRPAASMNSSIFEDNDGRSADKGVDDVLDAPPSLEEVEIPEDFRLETHGASSSSRTNISSEDDDEIGGTTARVGSSWVNGPSSSTSMIGGEDSEAESLEDISTLAGEVDEAKYAGNSGGGKVDAMLTDSDEEKSELPRAPPVKVIESNEEKSAQRLSKASTPSKKKKKKGGQATTSESTLTNQTPSSEPAATKIQSSKPLKTATPTEFQPTTSTPLPPSKTVELPTFTPKPLSPPTTPSPYPYLYRLQAVVLHYGSHDSGHFVTYRRVPHPLSVEASELTVDKPGYLDEDDEDEDGILAEDGKTSDDMGVPTPPGPAGVRRRKNARIHSDAESSSRDDTDATGDMSSSSEIPSHSQTISSRLGAFKTKTPTLTAAALKKKRKRKKAAGDVGSGIGGFVGGGNHKDRWFRISDERVDLVKDIESEVYGHGAAFVYMLFYERTKQYKELAFFNPNLSPSDLEKIFSIETKGENTDKRLSIQSLVKGVQVIANAVGYKPEHLYKRGGTMLETLNQKSDETFLDYSDRCRALWTDIQTSF